MQDERTLMSLGFCQTKDNLWRKVGLNQVFIAVVEKYNGPIYITLFLEGSIDTRIHSDNKGLPLRARVKECCSSGSLERAIIKFDLPKEMLTFAIGGIIINDHNPSV